MLIGAHESTAGGYHRAILRAAEDGCRSVQIFNGPPGKWEAPPMKAGAIMDFRAALAGSGVRKILVHGRYLVNPASPDPDLQVRSMMALREDYERSGILGAEALVIHPGSHRETGEGEGIRRAAEMIDRLLDERPSGPFLLLENTAGSGSSLGASFSHLAAIRERTAFAHRIAYCLDTAHAFAAGYDLRGEKPVRRALAQIDGEVGIENIRAFHLNDSAREFGSRLDRHARIGEGFMGLEGFRALLGRQEFATLPGVLETEPLPDGLGRYRPQVELLTGLEGI